MGCIECDCLASREWVYRHAIMQAHARIEQQLRLRRKMEKVLRVTFGALPRAMVGAVKERLNRKMRGAAPDGPAEREGKPRVARG
jgi:hypothetical protein